MNKAILDTDIDSGVLRGDSMTSAIARVHGLEFVTGNTGHYQRIQQLGYPLTLVNWRAP
jgi:tRNA(fMet)-specific endonuclease VapC